MARAGVVHYKFANDRDRDNVFKKIAVLFLKKCGAVFKKMRSEVVHYKLRTIRTRIIRATN